MVSQPLYLLWRAVEIFILNFPFAICQLLFCSAWTSAFCTKFWAFSEITNDTVNTHFSSNGVVEARALLWPPVRPGCEPGSPERHNKLRMPLKRFISHRSLITIIFGTYWDIADVNKLHVKKIYRSVDGFRIHSGQIWGGALAWKRYVPYYWPAQSRESPLFLLFQAFAPSLQNIRVNLLIFTCWAIKLHLFRAKNKATTPNIDIFIAGKMEEVKSTESLGIIINPIFTWADHSTFKKQRLLTKNICIIS